MEKRGAWIGLRGLHFSGSESGRSSSPSSDGGSNPRHDPSPADGGGENGGGSDSGGLSAGGGGGGCGGGGGVGRNKDVCRGRGAERTLAGMLASIELLKGVRHPQIATYVGCSSVPREGRIILISQHYSTTFEDLATAHAPRALPEADIVEAARGVTEGLCFLHGMGIVHSSLSPSNILLRPCGTDGGSGAAGGGAESGASAICGGGGRQMRVLISDHGVFYAAGQANVGEFSSPEVMFEGAAPPKAGRDREWGGWVDMWSLGAITLYAARGGSLPWRRDEREGGLSKMMKGVMAFLRPSMLTVEAQGWSSRHKRSSCISTIPASLLTDRDAAAAAAAAAAHSLCEDDSEAPPPSWSTDTAEFRRGAFGALAGESSFQMVKAVQLCMAPLASSRPTAEQLRLSPWLAVRGRGGAGGGGKSADDACGATHRGGGDVDGDASDRGLLGGDADMDGNMEYVSELAHCWMLSGVDLESEIRRLGAGASHALLTKGRMPARLGGNYISGSLNAGGGGWGVGGQKCAGAGKVYGVDGVSIEKGLGVAAMEYRHRCRCLRSAIANGAGAGESGEGKQEVLSLLARYNGVPCTMRAEVWTLLLLGEARGKLGDGAREKREEEYKIWLERGVGEEVERQIRRDVPRCHPYCPLIACNEGRGQLERVLIAWTASVEDEGQGYWQGIDGLAAPLIHLFFNDEALAWASLSSVIRSLLPEVFEAGAGQLQALNSTLGTMQRLLAFADPELCLHFRQLELTVDMFAVPWFITLFSHLLPIPDIYIVWDALIVGPPLLPVFIASSILRRLRSQLLLAASVDDALVILTQNSSVPVLHSAADTKACVTEALSSMQSTPTSILQGGCMGLHLLETTTAELVGELNLDNVMSLLAEGRLAVVDTSPADRFEPYAGGIGVSAPSAGEHGCRSMALAAATMVGERAFKMGEARSLVVAVTGMNESHNRLLADALWSHALVQGVCLLSLTDIKKATSAHSMMQGTRQDEPKLKLQQQQEQEQEQQQQQQQQQMMMNVQEDGAHGPMNGGRAGNSSVGEDVWQGEAVEGMVREGGGIAAVGLQAAPRRVRGSSSEVEDIVIETEIERAEKKVVVVGGGGVANRDVVRHFGDGQVGSRGAGRAIRGEDAHNMSNVPEDVQRAFESDEVEEHGMQKAVDSRGGAGDLSTQQGQQGGSWLRKPLHKASSTFSGITSFGSTISSFNFDTSSISSFDFSDFESASDRQQRREMAEADSRVAAGHNTSGASSSSNRQQGDKARKGSVPSKIRAKETGSGIGPTIDLSFSGISNSLSSSPSSPGTPTAYVAQGGGSEVLMARLDKGMHLRGAPPRGDAQEARFDKGIHSRGAPPRETGQRASASQQGAVDSLDEPCALDTPFDAGNRKPTWSTSSPSSPPSSSSSSSAAASAAAAASTSSKPVLASSGSRGANVDGDGESGRSKPQATSMVGSMFSTGISLGRQLLDSLPDD